MSSPSPVVLRGSWPVIMAVEQLTRWLQGESVHVEIGKQSYCVPDFSCCYPELAAEQKTREEFVMNPQVRKQQLHNWTVVVLNQPLIHQRSWQALSDEVERRPFGCPSEISHLQRTGNCITLG